MNPKPRPCDGVRPVSSSFDPALRRHPCLVCASRSRRCCGRTDAASAGRGRGRASPCRPCTASSRRCFCAPFRCACSNLNSSLPPPPPRRHCHCRHPRRRHLLRHRLWVERRALLVVRQRVDHRVPARRPIALCSERPPPPPRYLGVSVAAANVSGCAGASTNVSSLAQSSGNSSSAGTSGTRSAADHGGAGAAEVTGQLAWWMADRS